MTPYLYEHQNRNAPVRSNGKRFWGYPGRSRNTRPRVIGVHTAENIFDLIGHDTGAEGVAAYQASTTRPSSYHRIADRDSTVLCLPDEATAFGIGDFNSPTLHVSFALRAADWADPDKAAAARPMLERAADVAREWCVAYGIPLRWLTKAQADAGLAGFLRHGTYDPGRRSDPGAQFPAELFFELIRAGSAAPPAPAPAPAPAQPQPTAPPGDEMDRLPVLRRGATGQPVRNLQGLLVAAGRRVAVDGDFGPGTEATLREWQAAARAPGGADGICGPGSWGRLLGLR